MNRLLRSKQSAKCLVRFKSTTNVYSKTLNLPNAGNFNLSMKNIYENEENIKKASFSNFSVVFKF